MYKETSVNELVGKTLTSVNAGESEIYFYSGDDAWRMTHHQDCCEHVYVDDIVGDMADIVGSPILSAEEVSSDSEGPKDEHEESFTWTFYKIDTARGGVTIKWYGASNGYYSESVDFERVKP